jgi:hypothetical protein
MSKKNEIIKIPFYGDEILVIEKNGQRLVAMKPIVAALGLTWRDQQRIIENDPVLNSVKGITPLTGSDGKTYQMICLPLEYLNGWLFKVPASRYKGGKREAIIRYQKKCYLALYDYFHHEAAVNPGISFEQVTGVLNKLLDRLDQKDEVIRELDRECRNQREIIDAVIFGPKIVLTRQCCGKHKEKKSQSRMRTVFGFFTGRK